MSYARVSADVRLFLPLALTLLACGGATPSPGIGPNSLEGRDVARVVVTGNRALSDSTLIKGLHHRRPRGTFRWSFAKYNAPALALDRKRIEAVYRARGYFNARVQSSKVSALDERVQIVFSVFEGTPTNIIEVVTSGVPPESGIDVAALAANAKVVAGRRLIHERYLELKYKLQRTLEERGYAHSKVNGDVLVHRENRTARVVLTVAAGSRVKFGKVHVIGNDRVPDDAVLYRVTFDEGETYDPAQLERTSDSVRELGTFSSVRAEVAREGEPTVAETFIRVSERKRHEIKVGGGIAVDGTRVETRFRGEYANRMSIHPLITFRGSVRPGIVVYDTSELDLAGNFVVAAEASIQRQDVWLPLLSATVSAHFDIETFEAYSTQGPSTVWRLARPFYDRKLTLSTGWQFAYLYAVTPETVMGVDVDLGADDPYRIGFGTLSATLDLRDRPVSPRYGAFASATGELGHPNFGGTMSYRRLVGDLRGYVPPTSWMVIAAHVRIGVLDFISGDDEPFTRRFYSGGSSSHRGFGFRSLSPRSLGKPIGGNALIETGVETRSDIGTLLGQNLSLGVFIDGGDVTTTFGELDPTDLFWAVGFGFRVDTPLGPLRLDIAYRLNRIDARKIALDRFAFHLFSVGQAF